MSERRSRYYAYEARQGGVLWMDGTFHKMMLKRPNTVAYFQCKTFTGESRLMSMAEFKAERERWRQGLSNRASVF